MNNKFSLEFTVGIFILIGILCLGYLSIKLGTLEVFGNKGYNIYAIFSNSGGLKTGASVMIAGVEVGKVKDITLEDYQAKTTLTLIKDLQIQRDAMAAIKTKGLIGEKYVEILPGGDERFVEEEGSIRRTQSAMDIESLISKFAFGSVDQKKEDSK